MSGPVIALPRRDPSTRSAPRPTRSGGRSREWLVVFGAALAFYLAVAAFLFAHDVFFADALSRVANAYYVLFSRDPHLPALGFVWNPLPSLAVLPLLPAKALFPVLVTHGLAGVLQSALCMSAAIAVTGSCLRRLGVPAGWRWGLLGLFAAAPMIALYAGSGQSEPMLLLTLAVTANGLIGWVQEREPGMLVLAGIGLGLGYLARYEAAAPAIGVAALVLVLSYLRASGTRTTRARWAVNDVLLVAGPFLFAFALWAIAARLLVGEWFPTFSSAYGNTAQVSDMLSWIRESTGTTNSEKAWYVGRQLLWLTPVLVPLGVVAAGLGMRRRLPALLVAPVVFGSVTAFAAFIAVTGSSFAWMRFQIAAIPLTVLLAGSVIGAVAGRAGPRRDLERPASAWSRAAATALAVAATTVAIPAQARVLTDNSLNLAREEAPMVGSVFFPDRATPDELSHLGMFGIERQIAAEVDALGLLDAQVLGDSSSIYAVVLGSTRPRQFVITSDLDFDAVVDDPASHGVRYVLVSSRGYLDAIQRRWPDLYDNGAGIATLAAQWEGSRLGTWRLYRLD